MASQRDLLTRRGLQNMEAVVSILTERGFLMTCKMLERCLRYISSKMEGGCKPFSFNRTDHSIHVTGIIRDRLLALTGGQPGMVISAILSCRG
jgi:hypothetical protein